MCGLNIDAKHNQAIRRRIGEQSAGLGCARDWITETESDCVDVFELDLDALGARATRKSTDRETLIGHLLAASTAIRSAMLPSSYLMEPTYGLGLVMRAGAIFATQIRICLGRRPYLAH